MESYVYFYARQLYRSKVAEIRVILPWTSASSETNRISFFFFLKHIKAKYYGPRDILKDQLTEGPTYMVTNTIVCQRLTKDVGVGDLERT